MFSVRLVTADSYQAQPLPQLDPSFSEFRGSEIKHVPVIRIFGTTSNGEKTCLHIHGVFPYLFVPYTGEEDPGILAYRLATSLDTAINVSLGSATSNTQHVYLIQRVSGTPFYGYHRKEHQFLKIYFYNPAMIKRAADLLQNGSVLNQSLQPHEAHINYILQFMIDYNIYGMSLVNLRCVKHRRVAQTLADLASSGQSVSSENSDVVYLPINIERQSTCELEIDALASDIMNKLDIDKNLELNPGLATIWDEERARRAQAGFQGGDSQLVNPKSPARPTFNPTDSDIYQEQRLARRLLMISQCDESTLSITPNRSVAYAAEVREGENLLNSSWVPNISVQTGERIHQVGPDDSLGNMSFLDSPTIPASQNMTPDYSILGTDDMPLVDLLDQLAQESEENVETVDTDSLLGSQVSALLNDDKSEDEDVADLNLTCLQLDSLDLFEATMNPVDKQEAMKKLTSDKKSSSTFNVSPFLTPCEISSCSSKSASNDDTEKRERDGTRGCRVPQYDGAGDVSPTLLNSDNEDVQDNPTNAKDFSHLPGYNGTCEIISESRKSENRDQSMKITSRTTTPSITSITSDITIEYDRSKNEDTCRNSNERGGRLEVQPEAVPSGLTNDAYLGQYGGIGYDEPFDRLLEIGTDFVPDFEDMHSSMDIGILLSSGDDEKAESVGETVIDEEIPPLENVLNGDPCFTESAELDKSDLAELRDQYVSLLGNSLLPDIHVNPRVDHELGESTSFNETNFPAVVKNCETSTGSRTSRGPITSRDSSSSLENVAPNIQEPEIRGLPKSKLKNVNEADSQVCKELGRVTSDASDYNCNVVATWAELQNLQIVDKSESSGRRLSRTRTENVKYRPGPRSMKRRGIRRASPDKAASQVLRNNIEKAPFHVSNSRPESPNKVLRGSSKSPTKRMLNLSSSSSSTSSAFGTEKNSTETTSGIVVKNTEERLSCGPLPNVPRLSQSSSEDSSEPEFPSLRTAASLDAFHRSIIGSDNPLADIRNTLPGAKYSSYSLNDSDNLVEPIHADSDDNSANRLEDFDGTCNNEGQFSHGTSYYSSQRSQNRPETDGYQHRHCSLSRFNKIVQDQVFTSDEIWIIQKRKRGGLQVSYRDISSLCERQDCKLPIIRLRKIEQRENDEENVIDSRNIDEASINQDLPRETSNENVESPENPRSRVSSIESSDKNVEISREQTTLRVRKTRRKSEPPSLTSPATSFNDDARLEDSLIGNNSTGSNDPISRDLPVNEEPCPRQCHSVDRVTRDPYNTRRRSINVNFGIRRRRTAKLPVENEEKDKKEMKKPRAKTKYKDGNLPGIPGIVNIEIPQNRRRSRKILPPSNNNKTTRDNASEESPKFKKNLPSKLFPNWGAERETPKCPPNGIVKKSPLNGFVLETRRVEVTPEKRKGRRLKASLPISPIPKRNPSSPRDTTKNLSSNFLNFSSTPMKNGKATRQDETSKTRVPTKQKKLPETVALGLMLKEAKSRSTRMALKMLLQKRLNDKFGCDKKVTKSVAKKLQVSGDKTTENELVTELTTEKPSVPTISVNSEPIRDRSKNEESPKIQEHESGAEDSNDSDPPSFETVTDVSDTTSEKNCDSIPIPTLETVTEICNPSEFDGSRLSVEFCNSVDVAATDIFDPETAENSVIAETTGVEEFTNETKQPTYDTDRYENAIKEANFFAGKDYTIDAVSLEIPTCLFEEDSNSVDKRIPKRSSEANIEYSHDSCNNIDVDTASEISIDPRDLDVYDVESLTPSSTLSVHDDLIDTAESPLAASEADNFDLIETTENVESIDRVEKASIAKHEEILPEHESSFEEDSPSFEALSPEPRVCSLVGKSLEDEFSVDSRLETSEYPVKCDKTALTTINDETITNQENLSISIDNPKITGDESLLIVFEDSIAKRNKDAWNTIEDSAVTLKDIPSMTNENLTITPSEESSITAENSSIAPISKPSITVENFPNATRADKEIDDDNAKLDNEIKELVSQVVIEFKNELEISDVIENDSVASIDIEIQLPSNADKEIAIKSTERGKETLPGTEEDKEVFINTAVEPDVLEIVENGEKFSASSKKDEEFLINTSRENNVSAIVEKDETLSTSLEKETKELISVEKEKKLLANSQMEIESSTIDVEKNDEVPASSKDKSELLTICEKEEDLLAISEKESEMRIPVGQPQNLSASAQMEIESRTIVEKVDKLPASSGNKSEILKICEKGESVSASAQMEIESPMIVEKNEKLSKSRESESRSSMIGEKEKKLSTATWMATESRSTNGRCKIRNASRIRKHSPSKSAREKPSSPKSSTEQNSTENTNQDLTSPMIVSLPTRNIGANNSALKSFVVAEKSDESPVKKSLLPEEIARETTHVDPSRNNVLRQKIRDGKIEPQISRIRKRRGRSGKKSETSAASSKTKLSSKKRVYGIVKASLGQESLPKSIVEESTALKISVTPKRRGRSKKIPNVPKSASKYKSGRAKTTRNIVGKKSTETSSKSSEINSSLEENVDGIMGATLRQELSPQKIIVAGTKSRTSVTPKRRGRSGKNSEISTSPPGYKSGPEKSPTKVSKSRENKSKLLAICGKEEERLAVTRLETESLTSVEDMKLPKSSENESEPPMICEKDGNSSASTEKEPEIQISVDRETELLTSTPLEIESSAIVKTTEKLPKIRENGSGLPVSCEKETELLAVTRMSTESLESVEDEKLPASSRNESELLVTCETEKGLSASIQTEKVSMSVEDAKLPVDSENGSELPMTCGEAENRSVSTEKGTDMRISVEKNLPANTRMETESPMSVEKDNNLPETNENESVLLTNCAKENDLSTSAEKESEMQISVEKEKDLPTSTPMEIAAPTSVERDDKLPESRENESELPKTREKDKDPLATTPMETESSTTVEDEKLPKCSANGSELETRCRTEKEISADTPMEPESFDIIDKSEKISEITEKETTLQIAAESDKTPDTNVESSIKLSITPNDDKNFQATAKRQEDPLADTENENIPTKTILTDEKESEIADRKVEQSIIEIETKQSSPKELIRKKSESKVESEETERKKHQSEFRIMPKDNQTSDTVENVAVDINKNDLVISVFETEHCDLNEAQIVDTSKDTKTSITADNWASEVPRKRVECRPVSIKLVNIDLSKIRYFTPKNFHKPKVEEPASSQPIPQDNEKEKLPEKVVAKSESTKNSDENSDDRTGLEKCNGEIKSHTGENVENLATADSRSFAQNNCRKTRKRIPKESKMPERRSVRICAEMTLKLSQQESSAKVSEEPELLVEESTRDLATRDKVVSGSSLTRKIEDKKSQERESLPTDILENSEKQSKSPQEALTVESSMNENLEKITENTLSDCQLPQQESVEKETEMNISRELVLSEQIIADENAAPSSIKPKRRGRSKKNLQTNSQEVGSSQKITDENTAPIFDKPKRNDGSRKNSQVNLQDTLVDSISSKPTPTEEGAQKIVDKTSAGIDSQPIEFELKIAETNVDTQTLMVSSKRARSANDRCHKIRNTPRIREHSPSKSARNKNSQEVTKIPYESKSSMEQNSTENTNQDLTSSAILSLATRNIGANNSALKSFVAAEKIDEPLVKKPLLPGEIQREITDETSSGNNLPRKKICGEKIEPEISIIHKRRGRSEKKSETSTASSEIKFPSEECVDRIVEASSGHESSPQNIVEENTELKTSVTHKRRGRSGKIPNVPTSASEYKSGPEKTTRNIVEKNSQGSELLPKKIAEESNEPKTTVVLKRRGRVGKRPETKVDSQDSDLSLQQITDTSIESRTSITSKRKSRPGNSPESNTHKLSSEETSQDILKEKYSQEPKLLLRKISEESIESNISVVPKKRGQSVVGSEENSQKLSPDEEACVIAHMKSRKPPLVLRKNLKNNIATKISRLPKRRNRFVKKQADTDLESSTRDTAKNSQKSETAVQKIAVESFGPNCLRFEKKKGRSLGKQNTFKKSYRESGSSSDASIFSSTETYSDGSESSSAESVQGTIVSRPLSISVKRRGRPRKVPETNFHGASTSESTINENSHEIVKTTRKPTSGENSPKMEKTPEDNTRMVIDPLTHESPVTSTEPKNLPKLKKRVRFNKESIRRCEKYCHDSDSLSDKDCKEPSPKKHYKLSLFNRFPRPSRVNNFEAASAENSNDSSISRDSEFTYLESVCLFERLKTLREQKSDKTIAVGVNGVTEKVKSTSVRVPLDISSLPDITMSPRQLHTERVQGILKETTLPGNKEYTLQYRDDKLLVTQINWSDFQSLKSNSEAFNLPTCPLDRGKYFWPINPQVVAYAQLQKPKIVLKRLSSNLLKSYGIAYRPKAKIFVKHSKKSNHNDDHDDDDDDDDDEHQWPAYDGAADMSSSDTDEDPDVTIAKVEKRVCSYNSSKKTTPAKRDSIVTPKKRKLDINDIAASSPSSKRQALATTDYKESPTKTPYRSPSRTSMLKSPGRIMGNYSPLKIIVTSPKVRKEILEPVSSVQLDKQDDSANSPSSSLSSPVTSVTTTGRKNSRLHDNILRGRFTSVKSSLCELGDKHAPAAKMGSDRVGELDEIRSIGQTERGTINILCSTIASDCHEPTGIHDSATTLRDGKDVRKKLVFTEKEEKLVVSSNDSIDVTESISDLRTTEPPVEASKLQISSEVVERSARIDDKNESIKASRTLNNSGTVMFDAVPGTSQGCDNLDSENRRAYEIPTEPESDDDDDDDDDVCNVTFTQYINSQINKNDPTSSLDPTKTSTESKKLITIMPKLKPPSRQRVIETMEKYGIPKCRNQGPFFSVPTDVPKQKELAQKMLKVPGKGLKYLPQFVSSVEGVTGLARWRKMWLNEFHPSLARSKEHAVKLALASDERIIMTPLIKPPTQKQVKDWLRSRQYLEKKKNEDSEESRRKRNEPARIESQGKAVADENDECSSNDSDLSVVEPSPERTLVFNDTEKPTSTTLKIKLARKGLFKRMEDLARCKAGKEDATINSLKSSGSREKLTSTQDSNTIEMDPSLLEVLGKSSLFRDQEASRHLGVSCGQIEFLSDSTRSNVANENLRNAKALTTYQYLTIMCLEVHVTTRGDLLPDAQHDAIAAIFYSVQSDVPPTSSIKPLEHGVIVLADTEKSKNKMYYSYSSRIPWTVSFANNEEALLNSLVNLITRTDPEILIGWELETLSWGYVFQRASHLGMNLSKRISRIPATQCKWEFQASDIETMAEVKLPGRIVLDIWRLMRHEAALLSYTFENVIHHVLNERIPCPSFKILTEWWNLEKSHPSRWRVVEHYSIRVLGVFRILDQLDIIGRTSELARLFGIQFYEVFSRGSQFRVESVMLRLAKPLNYIAVSPSPQQRASMRAMEALPLIMEPESMFYSDPLIVLDFQSLYPSIIIAHNYCFSTCLGRIEHIGQPQPFEFGAYTLHVPKNTALKLRGKVNYAPCGVAYVKSDVRLGILPRMLTEILKTRFMVKKAMKDHKKDDKTLQRALHSRQMGLKFLANVTYGYTAANFSGRMPCIEVGDSVISKSKETLERAIRLVESTPRWGARVVYGDTDSLFILVPGKSKADAFVIGNEIADAVTASNPPPIKLKFEKVMYPAILQTKKRYCGYMYETPEQENPTYLAKGIETVRRDGCPAVSKILEKTLKILFDTKDVSLVKKYVTRQLDKVLRCKVSIQDLTFAKEFRGLKGYKAKACVPALELTRRLMRKDPRAVPRNSERVRYVIVAGAPNQALIHCVRTPWELINDPGLRPNAIYYVTRVIIPPLNRCLNLMGVDVNDWYREMPHRQILNNPVGQPSDKQKLTIFQYFGTIVCVSCGQPSNKGICAECLECPADTLVVIYEKLRWLDRTNNHVTAICQSCVGQADAADCASLDCPVLYRRAQAQRELTQAIQLRGIIECGNNLEF